MADNAMENPLKNPRFILVVVLVVLVLLPPAYSVIARVLGVGDSDEPFLEMPDEKHTECVKDTEYMRYHHWELLRGIREEVVRYGLRGDIGLNRCRDCHTSRERFCDQCHNATSLKPDCFGCHYYP